MVSQDGAAPPTPAAAGIPPRVWTVPAHDELHRDGEALVLHDGQVRRISPLGTVIRERASAGASLEELTAELEERFGTPPGGDATTLTREAVTVLLDAGLLSPAPP